MNSQLDSDNLNTDVYETSKGLIFLLMLMAGGSFFFGFIFNFSLEDKIISLIETNVKYNKKCPTQYKNLKLGYLLPKIRMTEINLSSRCIGTKQNMSLKKIETSLAFPSFSPLGLSLDTRISDKYSKIDITSVHSLSSNYFKINSNKLNAKTFAPMLNNFKLAGNFKVDSNIGLKKKNIESLILKVESKNFSIPSQNIQGFDIPNLNLGDLLLRARIKKKKKLEIQDLIIGKELSPIRAKISGNITLDKYNFVRSKLDLTATVKFSSAFLESFSMLTLFLDQSKQDEQGFYKMKIGGTLSRPSKPVFLAP